MLNPVYTIQPVVKPVVQRVWQPAVSCKQTSNRLWNRVVQRVYRCNWHPYWGHLGVPHWNFIKCFGIRKPSARLLCNRLTVGITLSSKLWLFVFTQLLHAAVLVTGQRLHRREATASNRHWWKWSSLGAENARPENARHI